MDLIQQLSQSLQTGFIDQSVYSNKEYLPQLLINDKKACKKILSTIESEILKCDEFWFSVAFVTTCGIATLINTLEEFDKAGKKGKILVSQYLNFTQPEALKRLLQFKNIELKIAVTGDFHSKGYLFKHGELHNLIIGSSNLTSNALCSNTEWNLKISATSVSFIILNAIKEFQVVFDKAIDVDEKYIAYYESIYVKQIYSNRQLEEKLDQEIPGRVTPNAMQIDAMANIKNLRSQGHNKALLISATGTGKTFLSAFDAKVFNPNRVLFIVHRLNIAKAAMKTFLTVFGKSKTMGLFSGTLRAPEKDFIFTTVQTISKIDNLKQFDINHFDYIVIDETHRAAAESYSKILGYFKPKFLLGMTATPERTDGLDVFKLFNYNIAYEIRLHKAMEENMLCPFHYYGVTDITVNGVELEENSDFSLLISTERIKHIIEKSKFYGCDDGNVRGLIFCSNIDECKYLSAEFNKRKFKTIALVGESTEAERSHAINLLESNNFNEKIDYIFTVDIFNEGIDIPRVNQIIMLRPTQSAIIFVQQLGRGLRKINNKEYLTVIDFIGNYANNYLVPIALYGDTSYNKDSLRKLMSSGSSLIPGNSTINFDLITRNRIYESIDSANMALKKDLLTDYKLLKYKLGRIPMMIDFVEHGSRDPYLYSKYSKSYFNFVQSVENELKNTLNKKEQKMLELFSNEINNSKRVEESLILHEIIEHEKINIDDFKRLIKKKYHYNLSETTIASCVANLNFKFITEKNKNKLLPVNSIYNAHTITTKGRNLIFDSSFKKMIDKSTFLSFLKDNVDYSIKAYDSLFEQNKFINGFVLYRKYSRKDVFRILNWDTNPIAQNVGGYIISSDKKNCPIFVNYHKEKDISSTTKYEDRFINNSEFEWLSKSKRNLNSPDVKAIINSKNELRLPLFIKKSNDEGTDFYYMGEVAPIKGSSNQTTMPATKGKRVSVVKIRFAMSHPVEDNIFNYITNSMS